MLRCAWARSRKRSTSRGKALSSTFRTPSSSGRSPPPSSMRFRAGGRFRALASSFPVYREATVRTSGAQPAGAGAENQVSGVFINVIPKDGGNTFKGYFFGNYTTHGLQSRNLTDEIKQRGLTTTATIDKIWDVNPAVGGPIRQDKLWY